jgi:hypothetical protein
MPSNKPKFLEELARHRFSRMFPRFHVATGGEPELSIFVIDEEDGTPVDYSEV